MRTGLERLLDDPRRWLGKARVGLIANPTSVDRHLRHAIDLLHAHPDVDLRVCPRLRRRPEDAEVLHLNVRLGQELRGGGDSREGCCGERQEGQHDSQADSPARKPRGAHHAGAGF